MFCADEIQGVAGLGLGVGAGVGVGVGAGDWAPAIAPLFEGIVGAGRAGSICCMDWLYALAEWYICCIEVYFIVWAGGVGVLG